MSQNISPASAHHLFNHNGKACDDLVSLLLLGYINLVTLLDTPTPSQSPGGENLRHSICAKSKYNTTHINQIGYYDFLYILTIQSTVS
jgi:hypothetical protein